MKKEELINFYEGRLGYFKCKRPDFSYSFKNGYSVGCILILEEVLEDLREMED